MHLMMAGPVAPDAAAAHGASRYAHLLGRALAVAGFEVDWTDTLPADSLGERVAGRFVGDGPGRHRACLALMPDGATAQALRAALPDIPLVAVEPESSAAARVDAVVTTSGTTAAAVVDDLADPSRLCRLLPFTDLSPIDSRRRVRAGLRQSLTARLRLPQDEAWVALWPGDDSPDGPATLRSGVMSLGRMTLPRWRLLVLAMGSGAALARQAMPMMPADRTRLVELATAAELLDVLASIDLFVALRPGAVAPVLAEAQASGVPVVAPKEGAALDSVIDGRTGRLYASGNIASLSNMTSFFIGHGDFRSAAAQAARETAYADFGLSRAAAALDGFLTGLIEGRDAEPG